MNKVAKIILIIVLCLAVVGGIVGVVAWTQSDKFDQKDLSFLGKYEVGGLDSNGNYMSTNASIYTKKPIECQGLNCNLVFDSTISYQLYFYDQNNEFVHTTGKLTGTFTEDGVPFFAKYVRIVITPNDDDKVTSMEVAKYAKQLNVSVNREQGFKNYTENLVNIVIEGKLLNSSGEVVDSDIAGAGISDYINVTSYKESMIFREKATDITGTVLFCYSADKSYIGYVQVGDVATVVFTSSEGINYYSIPVSSLVPSSAKSATTFIRVTGSVFPEIYCR